MKQTVLFLYIIFSVYNKAPFGVQYSPFWNVIWALLKGQRASFVSQNKPHRKSFDIQRVINHIGNRAKYGTAFHAIKLSYNYEQSRKEASKWHKAFLVSFSFIHI